MFSELPPLLHGRARGLEELWEPMCGSASEMSWRRHFPPAFGLPDVWDGEAASCEVPWLMDDGDYDFSLFLRGFVRDSWGTHLVPPGCMAPGPSVSCLTRLVCPWPPVPVALWVISIKVSRKTKTKQRIKAKQTQHSLQDVAQGKDILTTNISWSSVGS